MINKYLLNIFSLLRNFFLFLGLFFSLQTNAQSNAIKDNVNQLNEQSVKTRNNNRDQSLIYAQEAFKLAEKYDYQQGKAFALRNIGIIHFFFGESDIAEKLYLQSLSIYNNISIFYFLFNF